MPIHTVTVSYKTLGGTDKTLVAQSGNKKWPKPKNTNARNFKNFIDSLRRAPVVYRGKTPSQRDQQENKWASTCGEPQAIYRALNDGADPQTIIITSIMCNSEARNPCQEYCQQYIDQHGNIDWETITPSEVTMTLSEYRQQQTAKQTSMKKQAVDNSKKQLGNNPFAALLDLEDE